MPEQVELSRGAVAVIDTAGRACQAGVFVDGAPRAVLCREMVHGQAEALIPLLQQAVAEAGVAFADLAAVVATVGPGSFTGLRVGLAAAQGLGLAADCPVVGVSSPAAWAMTLGGPLRVVLDTRRGDAFVQDFGADGLPLAEAAVMPLAEAQAAPEGMRIGGDIGGEAAPSLAGVFAAACVPAHRRPPL
ncbi:MAG: tRNA (adenosine(37)-N6)-threonylcarbamoyltransferase complex dimerization subunit type 1 TsaB, partial [Rhodospirillaceae bacterium]